MLPPSSLTNLALARKRASSQDSILTDGSSLPDSLPSKLETKSHITVPTVTSTDSLAPASCSKGESTDALPDQLLSPTLDDPARELKRPLASPLCLCNTSTQPTSKLPRTPFLDPQRPARRSLLCHGSSATTRVYIRTRYSPCPVVATEQSSQTWCLLSENSPGLIQVSDYVARMFILLLTNSDTIFAVSTAVAHGRGVYRGKSSAVGNMDSSFEFVSDAATVDMARTREDSSVNYAALPVPHF